MPDRALRRGLGRDGRDDEVDTVGLNASNARQGIKTHRAGQSRQEVWRYRLNASNARQGIKTIKTQVRSALAPGRLNASNARQGIKTMLVRLPGSNRLVESERLQCPTGH